jgi:hypothetical protein
MPYAYEVREPGQWAEKVAAFDQRRLDDGAVVVLYGDCPRCQHFMDVELPIALQTGGLEVSDEANAQQLQRTKVTGRKARVAFTKVARCNCRMEHSGRPKDVADGCGAFGALEVG